MSKEYFFSLIEPLKENRFTVDLIGVDVPQYMLFECDIYFSDEKFIFSASIHETANYTFNPKNFNDIKSVKINYFDPIGDVLNGLVFDVEPISFKKSLSYRSNNVLKSNLIFLIKEKTMSLLYKNIKN